MNITTKRIRITLFLLSMTGLNACHHAPSTKNIKNGITAPAVVLEADSINSIIVPIVIKNKTYRFLVDTGSSINVINEKIANEISTPYLFSELPEHYQRDFSIISSSNGTFNKEKYHFLKPVTYYIGTQEINDEEVFLSTDLTQYSQAVGVDIDGIIGIQSFRKLSWQVDNLTHRLTITNDAPSSLIYQQCSGYHDRQNGMPEMWLNYNNASDIAFLIDTGANQSSITTDFIDYLRKNHPEDLQAVLAEDLVTTANGLSLNQSHILHKLTFNGMPLGEINVGESSQQFVIGMDFLSRFDRYAFIPSRMTFCYDVSSIEKKGIAPVRSISIRYINQHIEIFYNSEAKLAFSGLMNGDIILKANDKIYPPEQIDMLRKVLAETPKGALNLTIQRNAQQLEISL